MFYLYGKITKRLKRALVITIVETAQNTQNRTEYNEQKVYFHINTLFTCGLFSKCQQRLVLKEFIAYIEI